ncbi:unnamed protein product [Agarophyton chilense]
MDLESKKFDIECFLFDKERQDRKYAWEKRKEKREAAAELELKKMRSMMVVMDGFLTLQREGRGDGGPAMSGAYTPSLSP